MHIFKMPNNETKSFMMEHSYFHKYNKILTSTVFGSWKKKYCMVKPPVKSMFLEKKFQTNTQWKPLRLLVPKKIQKYLGCSLMEKLNLCCFVELNLVVVSVVNLKIPKQKYSWRLPRKTQKLQYFFQNCFHPAVHSHFYEWNVTW